MKTPALTVGSADDPAGVRALVRDVDIVLERGEKVALLGANGSGKTTLGRDRGRPAQPRTRRRHIWATTRASPTTRSRAAS